MVIDITREDEDIIKGQRCTPDRLLLPYPYLEGKTGNFTFECDDDSYPDYQKFGSTHRLWYLTAEELAEARNG